MSDVLSYPALRTVLEYLAPNKRMHIAARSPALRNFEKSIPIHFYYLSVKSYEIDGDSNLEISFENDKSGRKIAQRLRRGLKMTESSRTLTNVILGYKMICANYLEFEAMGDSMLQIPVTIEFLTKSLNINDFRLADFLQFVHPSSFPLKELALHLANIDTLDHPLAKTAESLEIHLRFGGEEAELNFLLKLPNKNVKIQGVQLSREAEFWLIENWKSRIGRSFSFQVFGEDILRKVLVDYKEQFGGEFKSFNIYRRKIPYCVSIPFSAVSELNIYGFKDNKTFFIAIEEHPIGTSIPFSMDSETKGSIIKRFKGKRKSLNRFIEKVQKTMLIFFVFALICFFYVQFEEYRARFP